MRKRAAQAAAFAALTGAITLGARTVAYALEGSGRAAELNAATGGPGLAVVALVSFGLALAISAGALWLAVVGVRERHRLRPERTRPPRVSARRLWANALGLFAASCAAFALLESYLHWRHGLGFHGMACLTGPVHRNALPILLALSLVAAAMFEALRHVFAWMRAAIRLLRTPPPRRASIASPRRRPCGEAPIRPLFSAALARPRAPPALAR